MVDNILGEKKEKGIDVESIDDILNAEFEDDVGGGNVQKLEEGVKIGKTDEVLEETLGSDIAEIEKPVKVSEKTKGVDEIDIGDLVGDKKPKESVPEEKDKEKEKKSVKQKKKVKVDDDIESIIGSSETPEKPTPPTEMDIGLEEELSLGGKEIEEEVKKVKEEVEDDFFKEPEKILLYAATKVGKTHAIASLIEAKLNERPDTKFYVIITDAGFWKTVLRYWRLKKLNTDVLKKQIIYRPILDLNEVFPVLTEIRAQANPDDWIIVDVMSDFWDRAQDKFIESCSTNGNIADLIIEASNDSSKFGTLSGFQWGYCKRLDNTISYYFVINSPCSILATASEKEIGGMAEALAGEDKVEKSVGFMYSAYKEVGYRPDGQKRLPYKFDDIVFLGKNPTGKHFFVMVGSRDVDSDFKKIPYGLSFWDAFSGYKKRKMM
ncbi:hypothetical protein KAW18_02915 [candidate division WOR-3 bacterium]|nr:hypothetical protein [candidate division WOR-3 bacterium]